ncbi:hypothetical protein V2I01_29685 [Micromonospora sp. BRA006-A]|nr:hypothetical protein [Micromonospora sp. BRA006-A]
MSEALLEAGAILPGGEAQAGRDVVTARRYTHPALSGRAAVRLAGATLGEAEDLSMEFLGFTQRRTHAGGHGPPAVARIPGLGADQRSR